MLPGGFRGFHSASLQSNGLKVFPSEAFALNIEYGRIVKDVSVKHFACNNQEENRNKVSSNLNERTLREIYLKAFEIAVREGNAKGIMTSYNRINGVYASNSHDLCTKILRNEWGFDGVVMTDWFSTSKGRGDNALAMHAGNDLIMPGGGQCKKEILNGVKTGRISENDLRRCCANVVKAIFDSATQREYIDTK